MTASMIEPKETIAQTLGLEDNNGRKPPGKYRWRWLVLAALAIIAVLVFVLGRGNGSADLLYETEPVRRGDLLVTVSATGTLAPVKEVEVGIEVSGTIKTVEADYNDRVEVGQVLARLDTTRLEAQALQSKSALKSAKAKVLQTQATVAETKAQLARLNHVRELSGGKVPSDFDLVAAKSALARAHADEASAKAAVEQAQAALNVNLTDISKAVIRSPIKGIVLKRSVEPGQTVAASFQPPVLFTLAEDLTQMELQVDLDEADVGQVQEGQEARFTVDAYPDRSFPASITQVRFGSQTVEGVVTYKAVLKVDNTSLSLRPGMTATAVITVNKRENVLLIANAALRFTPPQPESEEESGGSLVGMLLPRPPKVKLKSSADKGAISKTLQVWILRNGELTPVAVTTGVTDGIMTEIVEGALEDGAEVVIDKLSAP